jgi:hypothetical protein
MIDDVGRHIERLELPPDIGSSKAPIHETRVCLGNSVDVVDVVSSSAPQRSTGN